MNTPITGACPWKDVPLRRGILISWHQPGRRHHHPGRHLQFDVGDTVVAVSTLDAPVMQLNDLFV